MDRFNNEITYELKLNTIFLCGCKFDNNNPADKRIVLKKHIESKEERKEFLIRVIVLEEHFKFIEKVRQNHILYYKDIDLLNLFEVELLASLYASKIYILHETISTAAELGLFAGFPILQPKISLIIPKQHKDDVMTTFIHWAFYKKERRLLATPIEFTAELGNDKMTFFPDAKSSTCKIFLEQLDRDLSTLKNPRYTGIIKPKYNKISNRTDNVECIITDKLDFYIGIDAFKIQLLSMFVDSDIKRELRKAKPLLGHVNYIKKIYIQLLSNAFLSLNGDSGKNLMPHCIIKGINNCSIDQAIGFLIFWLKAIQLIKVSPDGNNGNVVFTIKCDLLHFDQQELSKIIVKGSTVYGKRF